MSFPKGKPPHNIRVLHGWLNDYSRLHDLPVGRLKRSVDHAIVISALDRVRELGEPTFAIKGGVAMELRLQLDARATKDLDAVFLGGFDGWLDALDGALEQPVADFSLTRGEPERIGATRTMRVDVHLDYRGRRWGTVPLEVAPSEAPEALGIERADPFDLTRFGLPVPDHVPIVGLAYLVAQKAHACTEPIDGRENPRVRDLVDLQLVEPLLPADLSPARDACVTIFAIRATHSWPPTVTIQPTWPAAYERLIEELGSRHLIGSVDDAARQVEALLARIDAARVVH